MKTFYLPDLGEGLQEAEVIDWHVEEGADVIVDQPLVSVETDKAVVEIPAPYAGRVVRRHAKVGEVVELGAPLVDFEDEAATDTGTVVGALPDDAGVIEESPAPAPRSGARVKATPAVRALARRLGVDLASVDASGQDGLVTASDVERVARVLEELGPPEPLRGVRRAMAIKMAQARDEIARTSVCDDADVHAWEDGADVTLKLVKALVAACRAEPALNVWYDSHAATRRVLSRIDLGIAVDTEDGLLVPVLRDVANRSDTDLRRGIDALRRDAEGRKIPLEEMRGATITLSNFGVFGVGRFAELMIVPPQVAIVGAGRIRPQAVPVDGEIQVRKILPVSVTFDHRVVNGGEATRFLAALIADLRTAQGSH